jgi:hypothetical protein
MTNYRKERSMIERDSNLGARAPAAPAPPRHNRWWYLEKVAIGLIALGALMMFQPFTILLFSYSFDVILLGVILFTIVSRMAD